MITDIYRYNSVGRNFPRMHPNYIFSSISWVNRLRWFQKFISFYLYVLRLPLNTFLRTVSCKQNPFWSSLCMFENMDFILWKCCYTFCIAWSQVSICFLFLLNGFIFEVIFGTLDCVLFAGFTNDGLLVRAPVSTSPKTQ